MISHNFYQQLCDFFSSFVPAYAAQGYISRGNRPNVPNPGNVTNDIQNPMCHGLADSFPNFTWGEERAVINKFPSGNTYKDKIDIIGLNNASAMSEKDVKISFNDTAVVVELDSVRAEQVAKKFLSRVSLCADGDLVYVAWIYPTSNSKVNYSEIEKYFEYCKSVANGISTRDVRFIGVICRYVASASNKFNLTVYF